MWVYLVGGLVRPTHAAVTWSGFILAEGRFFTQFALLPEQRAYDFSLVLQPELSYDWASDRDRITFVPFAVWISKTATARMAIFVSCTGSMSGSAGSCALGSQKCSGG
jgi:hypothetical protein